MLTISALPIFTDNYIWVLHNDSDAFAVDPGDDAALTAWLKMRSLSLRGLLITHRHADHVGGIAALRMTWQGLQVYGPPGISGVTSTVAEGRTIPVLDSVWQVMATPGHTSEHLAYYCPGMNSAFTGDTLFGAGCGRMFDGPAAVYQASLARLASLPASTDIYCAHEYTAANLRFAACIEPGNPAIAARRHAVAELQARGIPSIPFTLADELASNPFLRLDQADVIHAARQHGARDSSPDAVFQALRQWKNDFS